MNKKCGYDNLIIKIEEGEFTEQMFDEECELTRITIQKRMMRMKEKGIAFEDARNVLFNTIEMVISQCIEVVNENGEYDLIGFLRSMEEKNLALESMKRDYEDFMKRIKSAGETKK